MNSRHAAVLATLCIAVSPSVYFAVKQHHENQLLHEYLAAAAIDASLAPWDAAIALSRSIRGRFEVDEEEFDSLRMSDRPFLRESSDYLLRISEGQCGEGTRVLVNLMLAAGYDAARVSLYDSRLHSTHTLVSLLDGDHEYFVDSLNTTNEMNAFPNTHQINADSFRIVKYDDNVSARSDEAKRLRTYAMDASYAPGTEEKFFNRFRYYSYEAMPYTKLLGALGLDTRMLNFDRPPTFISSLAEKPYLIISLFWAGVSVVLTTLAALAAFLVTRRKRA